MASLGIRSSLAAALLVGVATSAGCLIIVDGTSLDGQHRSVHHRPTREWTFQIAPELIDETASLWVRTQAGDVTVLHTDGDPYVEVKAYSDSLERLNDLRISRWSEGGVLHLEPSWPGRKAKSNDCADLIIHVPHREGVEILSSAGDIEVADMSGLLRIETSAGDVDVEVHEGDARIKTNAGDIQLAHISGSVKARTNAGDINLDHVGWPIEAITNAGDIEAVMRPGFIGEIHGSTYAGDLRLPGVGHIKRKGSVRAGTVVLGDPGDAADECVFETSAGDVSVRILPETR